MKHTETYFGLIEVDGKISADNGKTFIEKITTELLNDIEIFIDHELTADEINDIYEIFS